MVLLNFFAPWFSYLTNWAPQTQALCLRVLRCSKSRRCYRYLIDMFDINMYVYVHIYIYIYIRYVLFAQFLVKNDVIVYLCIYKYI